MTPPSIRALEHATLNALPAPRIRFDGGFVVRGFLGGTGRANAAISLDAAPDADLPARIARIEAHYRTLGLPPRIRSSPLDPPGLEALLRAQGWVERDESLVTCGRLAPVSRADAAVEFLAAPGETWLEVIGTAEYQSAARRSEKQQAVPLLAIPATWLVLREEGVAAAAMAATCDGEYCGLFDLAVRPEFKRRGLARRMIGAAADWAGRQGAGWLFAQVAATNTASRQLQSGLGMEERYRYRYFIRA